VIPNFKEEEKLKFILFFFVFSSGPVLLGFGIFRNHSLVKQ
jgi:hypothetical protein